MIRLKRILSAHCDEEASVLPSVYFEVVVIDLKSINKIAFKSIYHAIMA